MTGLGPAMMSLNCRIKLVERLPSLPHELADFSRDLAPNFILRGILDANEASGQLPFDGVVWGVGSAQLEFCRQIVHHSLTCPIFASKPAPDCEDPVFAQLPHIESGEAPSPSQVILRLLYAPVLKESVHQRRRATFARFIRHLAHLYSFSNHRSHRIGDRRAWQPGK
jgi:hypothetical protein